MTGGYARGSQACACTSGTSGVMVACNAGAGNLYLDAARAARIDILCRLVLELKHGAGDCFRWLTVKLDFGSYGLH